MPEDIELFVKGHKSALIVNAFISCICYMHMAFSQNVGIDTERIINDESALLDSWKEIGRQGLLLSKAVWMPEGYNPYFAGVVFLAAFIVLGSLIAFLCWTVGGKDDSYPYGLFMVLFSVCPVWMAQFYFALQRTEVVLGLLYATVSVFALSRVVFFKEYKIYWVVSGMVFGIWSFSSYQGCVPFYIGLCIIVFLMDFAQSCGERPWREYMGVILKLVGGFILAYVGNMIITYTFFGMGEYLQEQIAWGHAPLSEIMYCICWHIGKVLLWGLGRKQYFSVYPPMCLFLVIVFIDFCRKRQIKKSVKLVFFLALAGLALTPFLMTVYTGNRTVERSQFVLQLISSFGCMFAYGIWKKQEGRVYQWVSGVALAVCVVVVWLNVSTVLQLIYTDDLRYQEDVRVASGIAEDIRGIEGAEDLPIICVGGYESHLNGAAKGADMYGVSSLGWDYTAENPTGATQRVVDFMKILGINITGALDYMGEAFELSKEMEAYPNAGYISVQDDYVIVKLSEVQ